MTTTPEQEAIRARVLALFKPPFKFHRGYIFDSEQNMVADQHEDEDLRVRGWGRIQKMPNAEALQDAAGALIAEALTEYWNRRATIQPVAAPEPVALPLVYPYDRTAAPAQAAPDRQQIEWSHALQSRLIAVGKEQGHDVQNIMAEAACLLAALTGRTTAACAATPADSQKGGGNA
jgi:hypothetical protein